jgi:hypothetical protein
LATLAGLLFFLSVFQDALFSPLASLGGEGLYMGIRRLPDLLAVVVPAFFLLLVPTHRLVRALPFVGWFLLIGTWMVFSGMRAGVTGQVLLELGALARCWPLFLAIACQEWGAAARRRFISLVVLSTTLECGIGLIEAFLPSVSELILPGAFGGPDETSMTYLRELPKGFVSGTLIENVGFAYTGLVGFVILAAGERGWLPAWARRWRRVLLLLHVIAVVFSGSLTVCVLVALCVGWEVAYRRFSWRTVFFVGAAGVSLGVLTLMIWGESLGWSGFVRAAQNQRLGMLTGILEFIAEVGWGTWLVGVGPSDPAIWQALRSTSVPGFVLNDTLVIQDLYWPSFALFYGLIGLISLMALFAFLWVRITQQVSGRDRGANMFKQLLVCVLLAGFLNQVLEYRPMAFFLWPLAGMLIQRGAQRG